MANLDTSVLDELQRLANQPEPMIPAPAPPAPIEQLRALDVAETQRSQIRSTLINTIIESLPDALLVVDEAGVIFLVNAQAEFLFGYHRSEMIGKPVEMLVSARYRVDHVQHRNLYNEQPRVRPMGALKRQLTGLRKNGLEVPIDVMLAPMITTSGMFDLVLVRRIKKPISENL
jgi:protein-histidine pros-kinase